MNTSKASDSKTKSMSTKNIYARKLFCAKCGHVLERIQRKQAGHYFKCLGSKIKKAINKSDWIIIPNHYEAIISKEDFGEVQARLARSKKLSPCKPAHTKIRNRDYLLKGKLVCGCCGHSLSYHDQATTRKYYCNKTHANPAAACYKMKVTANELEDAVMVIIKKQAEAVRASDALVDFRKVSESKQLIERYSKKHKYL